MDTIMNIAGWIGNATLPIFVFLTMFNVGITRTMDDFLQYKSEWKFFLRMLGVNFVIAPLLMWLILQTFNLDQSLEIGLIIFSMAAGAPFVIKLTQYSDHDIALGATLLVVLVLGTSLVVPIALPRILSGVEVDGMEIFLTLARQLVLPIILGLLLNRFFSDFIDKIQPWVAKLSNIALWVVVVGVLIGELEGLIEILGDGAILASVLFILGITGLGYLLAGQKDKDHQQHLGALGSGQRNTAACMIIAANNFSHIPEVLLIITIANTLGIIMLVGIAKYFSRQNETAAEAAKN